MTSVSGVTSVPVPWNVASLCLCECLPAWLAGWLSVWLSVCLSVCLSVSVFATLGFRGKFWSHCFVSLTASRRADRKAPLNKAPCSVLKISLDTSSDVPAAIDNTTNQPDQPPTTTNHQPEFSTHRRTRSAVQVRMHPSPLARAHAPGSQARLGRHHTTNVPMLESKGGRRT